LKLAPLIGIYLQQQQSVALNGFGRFYIDNQAVHNEEPDKHSKAQSPIRFEFNPAITTDPEFVNYIVKETGKIRPLAIADLESYTSLARQLLNISKPFVIEGVGTLMSDNKGGLDFLPGNFEPPKVNTDNDREKKIRRAGDLHQERATDTSYNYAKDDDKGGFNIKKMAGLLLAAAILAVGAWAVYKFIINKKDGSKKPAVENISNNGGTADTSTVKKETTPNTVAPVPAADGSTFRIVVKQITSKAEAVAYLNVYTGRGHKMTMVAAPDSSSFKMKIGITKPLADTLSAKDSIRKFYFPKERPYVEL
jgi:hypothetical protein